MKKSVLFFGLCFLTLKIVAQWNPNTSLNLEVAGLPVADMESLTTTDGKTWVAFYHENTGNYDMRVQLLDAGGNKLLGADGLLVDNQPSGTATFVFNICKDANDNLIVAYQDERSGSMQCVAYKISTTGTQMWGAHGVVLGDGLAPYPAVLSNGETVVAWNDGVTNTLSVQKISSSGSLVWATPKTIKIGTSNTTRGQLVANLNGSFTLIMQKRGFGINTTLYAQRYDADGIAQWPSPVQLNPDATSGARYYSVTSESDTSYCGFYSSAGMRFNSYVQRINPNGSLPYGTSGALFSTATGTNDPYQQKTEMAITSGSPYVWSACSVSDPNQVQYGVYVQKFLKSNGSRLFGDNALSVYPVSSNYETQFGKLSLVNDGPMFLTGDNSNKLYATRLDPNGNFMWPGNRIEVASTGNSKSREGFTGLANGQGIAIWTETRTSNLAYAQRITPGGVLAIDVSTQGGLPASINAPASTLSLQATIYPNTASQNVTWSILPVTGNASISSSGVVTGISNGTVWAKAVSVQDNSLADSLLITLTNQGVIAVTALDVITQGGVLPIITVVNGTLPMQAIITPSNATNQQVTWSIVPVTGSATIDATGLVTAISDGTVWAKAVSVAYPTVKDSLLITIDQFIQATGLSVSILAGAPPVITIANGTLQAVATITPANASNPAVTWSVIPVSGNATVSASGLITAQVNGTVWIKAVSVSNPLLKDSVLVTIAVPEVSGNVAVYPNPTRNFINLYSPAPHAAMNLVITDAAGKKVMLVNMPANAMNSGFVIHTEQLSAGIYFIKSVENADFQMIKWIKQ